MIPRVKQASSGLFGKYFGGESSRTKFEELQDRRRLLDQLAARNPRWADPDMLPLGADMDQKLSTAFDLICRKNSVFETATKIPEEMLDRYGRTDIGISLATARRLIELGVPNITIAYRGWDYHSNLVFRMVDSGIIPGVDQALGAFLDDNQRSEQEDVFLAVTGEINRTPKMNAQAGRDHWQKNLNVLLTGRGIKGGVRYGKSDRLGVESVDGQIYSSDPAIANTFICGAGGHELITARDPVISEVLA